MTPGWIAFLAILAAGSIVVLVATRGGRGR
jgi:hypothetical protein